MYSVLEVVPGANAMLANPQARADRVCSFATLLMGLNHPVQWISQAREVDSAGWPWPKPPQISRRWLAVVDAPDDKPALLDWRTKTLAEAMSGIDLHCQPADYTPAPPLVEIHREYVVDASGDHTASLVVRQWPREVGPGWLGMALAGETPVDAALHFGPKDPRQFARYLQKQQQWQADELAVSGDAADELGHHDAHNTRRKLVAGIDRPCTIAIVLTVHARSLEQLRARLATTRYDLGLKLADVRPIDLEHDLGRAATEPGVRCTVSGAFRTLDCTSVATTDIFQPPTVNHRDGIDIGVTHNIGTFHSGRQLVRLDPYDANLEGFSGVVVGKKRMGKSYFLKVFARGLARAGVEVTIVEQRRPPEYAVLADEPNVSLINIEEIASDADEPAVAMAKRVEYLRRFTTTYWDRCRADPRPRMLIVDEAWALLKDAQSADWIETVARTGGHFGLALWVASQQVREFLETGRAVLDNAEMLVCLKQLDTDLVPLAKNVGMPDPARAWLAGASRGQVLLKVSDVWLAVDVARVPEHFQITTDPRDFWQVDRTAEATDDEGTDHAQDHQGSAVDWRRRRVPVPGTGTGAGAAGRAGLVAE